VKCKNPKCDLESRHLGNCKRLVQIDRAVNRGVGNGRKTEEGVRCSTRVVEVEQATMDKTPNRRNREAYNRYMREYMRRRRAGFIGIAYG
jgi:hypothetical protein